MGSFESFWSSDSLKTVILVFSLEGYCVGLGLVPTVMVSSLKTSRVSRLSSLFIVNYP